MTTIDDTEKDPAVALAQEWLGNALPLLPTLVDRRYVPAYPTLMRDDVSAATRTRRSTHAVAERLVQAVGMGVTREDEVATLVLATVLAQDPRVLLDICMLALERVELSFEFGRWDDVLPKVVHIEDDDGLYRYVLVGEAE
jgi:hypothetical protein